MDPSLDRSQTISFLSIIRSILVLLAKLFFINLFKIESVRSYSSSCCPASLFWSKDLVNCPPMLPILVIAHHNSTINALIAIYFCRQSSIAILRRSCHQPPPNFAAPIVCCLLNCYLPPTFCSRCWLLLSPIINHRSQAVSSPAAVCLYLFQ
jgi:hypothetical protein